MYYCETSNHPIPHRYRICQQVKCAIRRWTGLCRTFLKAMVTPETTTPSMAVEVSKNIWFGAVKTLFWIINAIIVGIVMAKICS